MLTVSAANGYPTPSRTCEPNRPLSPIRWLAALGLTALAAPRALADSFSRGKPSSQQFGVQVAQADAIGHTKIDHFPRSWPRACA
ncbi:hypothetical protein JR064_18975 [Xanthomonas sp. CFBP 8703]|uniref:Uncharacterized protein n=1 Tax=Xanthomonas bonasiae TaxID=2810351 RepID=A0ABS3B7E8_9XANT|nr:hypothetical protein [Xanthomonas bonasiae]MBN6104250.1 hypothetical protein [Xanthomonas bonasiae]